MIYTESQRSRFKFQKIRKSGEGDITNSPTGTIEEARCRLSTQNPKGPDPNFKNSEKVVSEREQYSLTGTESRR